MLKNLPIAAKIFASVNLLFVPAIAVLLIVASVTGERWRFSFVGLLAIFANAAYVISSPRRARVWTKVVAMAGYSSETAPRASNRVQPLSKG